MAVQTITSMYTIYVGAESTMKAIVNRKSGIRVLNRKTMRWQDFAPDAVLHAVKDESMSTGWEVQCSRDLRSEAKAAGFIL